MVFPPDPTPPLRGYNDSDTTVSRTDLQRRLQHVQELLRLAQEMTAEIQDDIARLSK